MNKMQRRQRWKNEESEIVTSVAGASQNTRKRRKGFEVVRETKNQWEKDFKEVYWHRIEGQVLRPHLFSGKYRYAVPSLQALSLQALVQFRSTVGGRAVGKGAGMPEHHYSESVTFFPSPILRIHPSCFDTHGHDSVSSQSNEFDL